MKIKTAGIFILFVLILLMITGCGNNPDEAQTVSGGEVSGSEAIYDGNRDLEQEALAAGWTGVYEFVPLEGDEDMSHKVLRIIDQGDTILINLQVASPDGSAGGLNDVTATKISPPDDFTAYFTNEEHFTIWFMLNPNSVKVMTPLDQDADNPYGVFFDGVYVRQAEE